MSSAAQVLTAPEGSRAEGTRRASARAGLGYLRRNPSLGIGLMLLLTLVLFVVIGHLTVDTVQFRPLSTRPLQPPSWELPFGSDKQGRNLYAVMVEGTPLTLRIGLLAGVIGVTLGATLAFIAGYYGGWADNVIRIVVDVGLTIPGLLILIIIAMRVRGGLTVDQMALVVGLLAWLYPARTIRSQVLTLKQRGYVQVARLSGMSNPEVIAKELLPNLLPYLGASLVGSVSAAILASIGLEVLGLGPFEAPTLGMTIYWVNYNAAIINGWWWWWVPPIIVIAILFIGLFLVAVGLDEIANPRVRNRV
ncbi:MAG: ABC transporter permease [Chloroflexia bacterium]|nr:ABC transporter permease [Chloroflexia bacterium]